MFHVVNFFHYPTRQKSWIEDFERINLNYLFVIPLLRQAEGTCVKLIKSWIKAQLQLGANVAGGWWNPAARPVQCCVRKIGQIRHPGVDMLTHPLTAMSHGCRRWCLMNTQLIPDIRSSSSQTQIQSILFYSIQNPYSVTIPCHTAARFYTMVEGVNQCASALVTQCILLTQQDIFV